MAIMPFKMESGFRMAKGVTESKYKNVTVRLHFPDREKEDFENTVRKATEKFLKKAETRKRKQRSIREKSA